MSANAIQIWEDAQKLLAETLPKGAYERWISVISAGKMADHTLHLNVSNDLYLCWLEENYLPFIEDAVSSVANDNTKIRLVVDPGCRRPAHHDNLQTEKAPAKKTIKKRLESSLNLNPKYTFDAFVVGPSNSFSHAASIAVAQTPARAYNPLFIYGGTGLGKTHLMHSIGDYIYRHGSSSVCYITSEDFLNEYIHALQTKHLPKFRQRYRGAGVLLIDDIHFLAGKDRIQEEFFHTFNALFESHKQLVLTSDKPPSDLEGLEHRLVSRFEWGLVTQLEKPDMETRIAILREKETSMSAALPDDVILFIAERIKSNIRRLEGALIRVASYISLTRKQLSEEKMEDLLRDLLDEESENHLTLELIQKEVAQFFDISRTEMIGQRRPKNIAFPRQVAMYLCRTMTVNSLPVIGEAFGRNHATVLYACRSVEDRLQQDVHLRGSVNALRNKLSSRSSIHS